jgi:pantoate--beta-alanine ligase
MTIVAHGDELRPLLAARSGPRVLVPTMGALHAGHLALIGRARELAGPAGTVAVSIFVNPIQFDRAADLASYPQPLDADLAACRAAGVDVVFTPTAESMYFPDRSVTVTESQLSRTLCGATRPGHFDGVCTVVLKLFLLSGCDVAVFGEKDFQQLAVIRRMVRDLNVPVTIIGHPTVREADGLALSSRNVRLTPAQRADAPRLRQALLAARAAFTAGTRSAAGLLEIARQRLADTPLTRIDYLELVDAESLQPVAEVERPAVLATAVFYGEVRLIDHVTLAGADG